MPTRLLIVQPYVPEYRAAFFRDLRSALAAMDVQLTVAAGRPQGELALRGDDSRDEVDIQLEEWGATLAGRRVNVRRLEGVVRRLKPQFVIAEQAIKNVEIYPLLARQAIGGPRVALWGHGRSYSTKQSAVEAAVKQWVTRRGDWFFAYTEAGARYVVDHGFPAGRVTVVNNTIDTAALEADLEAVTDDALDGFRDRLGLTAGRTALFIGGVDDAKGIDFLLTSAREISQRMPGFVLLVAGDGGRRRDVERMEMDGAPIRYLGRVEGRGKALTLKAADLILIPEWVGLVAVDGLVAGRPIVTTNHPSHSPEFEYLAHGKSGWVTSHSTSAYVEAVLEILEHPDLLRQLQRVSRQIGQRFTMEVMVANFAHGVASWTQTTTDLEFGRSR